MCHNLSAASLDFQIIDERFQPKILQPVKIGRERERKIEIEKERERKSKRERERERVRDR